MLASGSAGVLPPVGPAGGAGSALEPPRYDAIVDSPIGLLGLSLDERGLRRLDLQARGPVAQRPVRGLAARACDQLLRYFDEPGVGFDLPLSLRGTAFQQRVWRALCAIPCAEVRRYGEIAAQLGSCARAVGGACRANPIPIVVPCHRVVGATGDGGFMGASAGAPLELKRWLLRHEAGA